MTCMEWMALKRRQDGLGQEENFKLLALAQEVEAEPVALSCSFFVLTYNFIGSVSYISITIFSLECVLFI